MNYYILREIGSEDFSSLLAKHRILDLLKYQCTTDLEK